MLDAQISAATRERYERLCSREQIPLLTIQVLGAAIGKPERMVAAVTDQGFANMITTCGGGCANAGRAYVQNKRSGGNEQNG